MWRFGNCSNVALCLSCPARCSVACGVAMPCLSCAVDLFVVVSLVPLGGRQLPEAEERDGREGPRGELKAPTGGEVHRHR